MNEELERKLQKAFPFMQRGPSRESSDPYAAWGCECEDGWFALICELCQAITDRYGKDGIPVDIVVTQVKEKYAGLRFYYSYEDTEFTKSGMGFHPEAPADETRKALRQDIARLVWDFEEKSETICEECGASGAVRTELRYLRTLCDSCYQKRRRAISKEGPK